MPYLKLVTDEPEIDPPAPIPLRSWRGADGSDTLDAIAEVEKAFGRAQRAIDSLSEDLDALENTEPYRFPQRTDDDDGPWAA